ncbi:MAG: hypothetical protein JO115_18500 [Pseudonocardiales bacterium]|nr:hypothetical protein [Pseudonocardiales bacterium]
MSDRGETEAYLAAELDSLRQALAAGDQPAVMQRIEHVRAEAGPETAAVLERALKEGALSPPPAQPVSPPTTPLGPVRELPPPSRTKLLIVFSTLTVALLLVVAVLVTVIILRPPTTTASPPPQSPSGTAGATTPPPTTTATSTTNVSPPVPPSEQAWTAVWPETKQITIPGDSTLNGYSVDLEIPQVEEGILGDLHYYDGELEKETVRLMGTGTATLPAPNDCSSAARTSPAGHKFAAVDMIPGKTAWCIVTRKGRLVWLHLLSGGGSPGAYTLRCANIQPAYANVRCGGIEAYAKLGDELCDHVADLRGRQFLIMFSRGFA